MRKLLLAFLAPLVVMSTASATMVTLSSSSTGRSVEDSSHTLLPNGDLFMVGTFTNPGAITIGNFATVSAAAGWQSFGSLSTTTIFGNAGKLTGSITDNSANADSFNGDLLYVWVFNASTTGAATQMGIFRATAGSPAWVFPTNANGVGDSLTISANETSMTAVNGVGSTSTNRFTLVSTASVPEPTTFALLGVAGVMALRRRRQA